MVDAIITIKKRTCNDVGSFFNYSDLLAHLSVHEIPDES